ncbi:hypothetical protein Y032_0576g216 [Ancylostoma ceylanicum]|uniref:Tc1-like transposase DDE domain-containing protein n=1 Tax=Ancylostoma ceylanicum TaxID=53326 RepID=A0A016WN34_9BILA|nr:hypothetical protein Y032_0576g216 [Ancylostoma ceylanicum]
MEDNHSTIVALYRSGKKPLQIFKELKSVGVSQSQVYRTIKRYLETGSSKRRYGGRRRRTVRIAANIGRLRKRLQRNPRQSSRKLSKGTGVSRSTVMRIINEDLGLRPLKLQKVQELSSAQKRNRLTRSRLLLRRAPNGELESMVFSDEKIFTVEQVWNKQNDRLWLKGKNSVSSSQFNVTRKQGPPSIMVWAGITESGRTPLVFLEKRSKMNAELYRFLVLKTHLKPWAEKHFGNARWIFQQGSAPCHTALSTQSWLRNNVPDFISPTQWPAGSPDLNPMDFSIWSILESEACSTPAPSGEVLKARLRKAWLKIPQNTLRAACQCFKRRLSLVIKARGGHFENSC